MRFPIAKTAEYNIEGEFVGSRLFIHMDELKNWSPGLYKDLLVLTTVIKDAAFERGIEEVFVAVPDDKKLIKFQTMFGFEPWKIIQGHQKVILMRQSTNRFLDGY